MTYKICLFGKHYNQIYTINLINKLKFAKPIIILDKPSSYIRDKELLSKFNFYADIELLEKEKKVKIFSYKNINSSKFIKFLKKKNINLGLSIACRSIFKKEIVKYFNGKLYNLHDSYLPMERGGALNSWRIILNRKSVGNTIHKITTGIDSGDIILQKKINIKKKNPCPIDYDYAQNIISKPLIKNFLVSLKKDLPFKIKKQKENQSEYFGRLYTKINGALDVDQKPIFFERFVRAFSHPYEGAWIKKNDKKIYFKKIKILRENIFFDKILNGRVYKKNKHNTLLIVGGGLVEIDYIYVDGKKIESTKFLKINDILRNSPDNLFQSRSSLLHVSKFKK